MVHRELTGCGLDILQHGEGGYDVCRALIEYLAQPLLRKQIGEIEQHKKTPSGSYE